MSELPPVSVLDVSKSLREIITEYNARADKLQADLAARSPLIHWKVRQFDADRLDLAFSPSALDRFDVRGTITIEGHTAQFSESLARPFLEDSACDGVGLLIFHLRNGLADFIVSPPPFPAESQEVNSE